MSAEEGEYSENEMQPQTHRHRHRHSSKKVNGSELTATSRTNREQHIQSIKRERSDDSGSSGEIRAKYETRTTKHHADAKRGHNALVVIAQSGDSPEELNRQRTTRQVAQQSRSPSVPTTTREIARGEQRRTSVSNSVSTSSPPPTRSPQIVKSKLFRRIVSRSRSRSWSSSPPPQPASYGPQRRQRPALTVDRENPLPSRCLGIFGLSSFTQGHDLQRVIERAARCDQVTIVHDRQTQRSRGFAFAHFRTVEDAAKVRAMLNGMELDKKLLRCDYSLTDRPHSPTPGMYMGHKDKFAYRPTFHQPPPPPRQQFTRFQPYARSTFNDDRRRAENYRSDDRTSHRFGPPPYMNGSSYTRGGGGFGPPRMRDNRDAGFRR